MCRNCAVIVPECPFPGLTAGRRRFRKLEHRPCATVYGTAYIWWGKPFEDGGGNLVITLTDPAQRQLEALLRKNPDAYPLVRDAIRVTEEANWSAALRAKQIKVLDECVGEIRDMRGSYRIVFFWVDGLVSGKKGERTLYVTAIQRKSVLKPRMLGKLIKAAKRARRELLGHGS